MSRQLRIPETSVVLFQGDSITDTGRNRVDGASLGRGYVFLAVAQYELRHAERRVRFLNRGISGNQARDLRLRWKEDALDLKPDILSLLIGVNDAWRNFDSDNGRTDEEFATDLRALLRSTIDSGTCDIVLGEPILLPSSGLRIPFAPLMEEVQRKAAIVRRMVDEYETAFIPYQAAFDAACKRREPDFWAPDGVHPSPAGHALMAQEWLRVMGEG